MDESYLVQLNIAGGKPQHVFKKKVKLLILSPLVAKETQHL